jgi:hypothetical protein
MNKIHNKNLNLSVSDVVKVLKTQGINATPDKSLQEIAEESHIKPMDLFGIISSHLKDIRND